MIDEKKLIERLNDWMLQESFLRHMTNPADTIAECIKAVEEQPKIGGWIPCSERLPEKKECGNYRGRFLVTVYTNKLTTLYMEYEYTTIRGKEVGRWLWNDRVNIPWEVIAWQPLPEAYHE